MTQEPAAVQQVVHVESGFGYGCVGADIHVFGDGKPVYLLFGHRQVTGLESQWLRAQPSRMLDARAEVVDFTGRADELEKLATWRDADTRFAVRWVHGEGGQGKTRLANLLATESQRMGWKVVDAVHGTDAHPPAEGSQDLRLDGHKGVLLLVDYADRWPISDLSWLFHNRLLRRSVPARILLIGRSASGWPALRGKLNQLRESIDTSDQHLPPLPDDGSARDRMFTTARECFTRHYPHLTDPHAITPPGPLGHPDFGLTLAVHMAALVAVDAAAHGRRAPADVVGLTVYLLDREHENWRQLYENAERGLGFRTPDAVMARTVFAATLAGPTHRQAARTVLELLMPQAPTEQILTDHAVCYPPTDPARAHTLEPLLPDRLAEDFLALMLPGSPITGYPTDDWASTASAALLRRNLDGTAPAWTPRAVSYLAAAADRWPHVGDGHLYPVVKADPRLALDAGSAALTVLARIGDGEFLDGGLLGVLESIDAVLPGRHFDLDVGIASVAERLTARRLADTRDPGDQAVLHSNLSTRYDSAGLGSKALISAEEAVKIFRPLAEAAPDKNLGGLAGSLINLSSYLSAQGRRAEALVATEEATGIFRQLAEADPDKHLPGLSGALLNLGNELSARGEKERALRVTLEAAAILDRLAKTEPSRHMLPLALCVDSLSLLFSDVGRPEHALEGSEGAIGLLRLLSETDPGACLPDLARALRNRCLLLYDLGRLQEALQAAQEVVTVHRRLVEANPDAHRPALAASLDNFGGYLVSAGRLDEALPVLQEAAGMYRRLMSEVNPDVYPANFAKALNNLSAAFARLGRLDEALPVLQEATDINRRLAEADPDAHLLDFAGALDNLGALLAGMQRPEVLLAVQEAVVARRRLAETDPDAHLSRLATSLNDLAGRLRASGRLQEALSATREAVVVRKRLAEVDPDVYQADLAKTLVNLAGLLSDLGQDGALPAAHEALGIWWRLVEADPATHLPNLAVSVNSLAGLLTKLGRRSEALAAAEEVVETLRRLAAADPAAYRPFIANALWGVARMRAADDSGLPHARAAIEEAVFLFLQLASRSPQAYADDLRGVLGSYVTVLDKLGLTEKADKIRKVVVASATIQDVYQALADRTGPRT
ncbi:tetratricopeptide repeat protein [Streptomyces inhibens]|uniref:tetratricopeptide repeat protein n=1 Tax=Streptomyces inhibens TaxID=2293571 RepID=UPI001EE762D2|nr:tetratricopeptide repeat protein [Streptomyces inhibens]UKY48165.1 tetratricopeptide repeat protein [Streptomyces inhibens]